MAEEKGNAGKEDRAGAFAETIFVVLEIIALVAQSILTWMSSRGKTSKR